MTRPLTVALALAAALGLARAAGAAPAAPLQPSPAWEEMATSVLGEGPAPIEDAALLDITLPARADDPAQVPVRVTQGPGAPAVKRLWLVIDQNPAPVAGTFTFGKALMPLDFETRVRVNAYSDVRAVAELEDGRRVMAGGFVKASGGCAAPASGDAAAAAARMGEMRLKAQPAEDGRRAATLMIRHPMNSGLQRDQVTLLDIPAMFIQTLAVRQGETPLFEMDAGISIAENPAFTFALTPGAGEVAVHAEDTDGHVWDRSLPLP